MNRRTRRVAIAAISISFAALTGLTACEPATGNPPGDQAPVSARSTAVDIAKAQVGKPYRSGAAGPDAFDCSGLTSYAWGRAGITLPRTSKAQYSGTARITKAQLQPGDLIFYSSSKSTGNITHVAMYIGGNQLVQAQKPGVPANIQNVDWWSSNRVGFGRIPGA